MLNSHLLPRRRVSACTGLTATGLGMPLNDLRNNADHGKFAEHTGDQVSEMLTGVSSFLQAYL